MSACQPTVPGKGPSPPLKIFLSLKNPLFLQKFEKVSALRSYFGLKARFCDFSHRAGQGLRIGRWKHMTTASKLHIPFLWGIFLRLDSSSSCCGACEQTLQLEGQGKGNFPENFQQTWLNNRKIQTRKEEKFYFSGLKNLSLCKEI